jgi:hypothetical protein
MAALIAGGRTCISTHKPYNATSGLSEKSQTERSRTFCSGIGLTWAAKPKVNQSL